MSPNIISWRASADNYTVSHRHPGLVPICCTIRSIDRLHRSRRRDHGLASRTRAPASHWRVPSEVTTERGYIIGAQGAYQLAPCAGRGATVCAPRHVLFRRWQHYIPCGRRAVLRAPLFLRARLGVLLHKVRAAQYSEHEALDTLISLGDVERVDFEAFLSILYPP
ncbi:hypothetical protein BC834DRAFT_400074 [Gloeopeniophorella convolvens]|nr:hypothetical protein BC834DRAFT_400074 [Gloeopeniophorella convolvens]